MPHLFPIGKKLLELKYPADEVVDVGGRDAKDFEYVGIVLASKEILDLGTALLDNGIFHNGRTNNTFQRNNRGSHTVLSRDRNRKVIEIVII